MTSPLTFAAGTCVFVLRLTRSAQDFGAGAGFGGGVFGSSSATGAASSLPDVACGASALGVVSSAAFSETSLLDAVVGAASLGLLRPGIEGTAMAVLVSLLVWAC